MNKEEIRCLTCDFQIFPVNGDAKTFECYICKNLRENEKFLKSQEAIITNKRVQYIEQPTGDEVIITLEGGTQLTIEIGQKGLLELQVRGAETGGRWVRTDILKLNNGGKRR